MGASVADRGKIQKNAKSAGLAMLLSGLHLGKKIYLDKVQLLAFSKHPGIWDLISCKPSAEGLIPPAALEDSSHWRDSYFWRRIEISYLHCKYYSFENNTMKLFRWSSLVSYGGWIEVGSLQFEAPTMFCVDVTVSVGPCKCVWGRNACSLMFP